MYKYCYVQKMLRVNFVTYEFCNINFKNISFVSEPLRKNQTRNGRKTDRFSLIRFPFAHRVNGSLLFVRLLTKKHGSYLLANGLNGLNGLNVLAHLCFQQDVKTYYTASGVHVERTGTSPSAIFTIRQYFLYNVPQLN
jgi:hypothetical protein